jgi:hypothetical protein
MNTAARATKMFKNSSSRAGANFGGNPNRDFLKCTMASTRLVSTLNKLPPTYTIGEKFGFTQFVPDPVHPQVLQHHLDKAAQAEKDVEKYCSK